MCPCCGKHKLLKAEGKWYCPFCFHVYHHLPFYKRSTGPNHFLYPKPR